MKKLASKHNLKFVDSEIQKIKKNNLYRNLRYGVVEGSSITINGKKLLNLCSNDYLGIKPTTKGQKQTNFNQVQD